MAGANHTPDPIGSWSISEGMDDILSESCHLMAARGFHGTSMRDLAQATGRSLSGLYHYFRSKEDLVFLINFHGFTTLNTSWARMARALDDPNDTLYAFVFSHTSYFVEHVDEMRVMTWGTQALNLEKARVIQKLKDRYTQSVKDIVREVFEAVSEEPIDDRHLARETFLLFGMMNWTFSWYSPGKYGTISDLINDVFCTFVSGLVGNTGSRCDCADIEKTVRRIFRRHKKSSMWADAGGGHE